MAKPEAGKTYNVSHSRKGDFVLAVTNVGDEWVTGNLIEGKPRYLNEYNGKELGEEMTVRISFCTFEEVKHG